MWRHNMFTLILTNMFIYCGEDCRQNIDSSVLISPIGDAVNVDTYDFIVQDLKKYKKLTRKNALNLEISEKQALSSSGAFQLKPESATINENQLSHIVNAFCIQNKCASISIYAKNGETVALSTAPNCGRTDWIILEEEYWKILSSEQKKEIHMILPKAHAKKIGFHVGNKCFVMAIRNIYDENELVGFVRFIKETSFQ